MKRYDKNNDGILDKDELSQMGGDPQKYDANHDGKVTMDELVAGLKGFSPSSDDADSGGKAKARLRQLHHLVAVRKAMVVDDAI